MSDKETRAVFASAGLISLQHVNNLDEKQRAIRAFAIADEMMRLHDDGCPHHDDDEDDIDERLAAAHDMGEAAGLAAGIAQGRADLLAEQAAAAVKPGASSKK